MLFGQTGRCKKLLGFISANMAKFWTPLRPPSTLTQRSSNLPLFTRPTLCNDIFINDLKNWTLALWVWKNLQHLTSKNEHIWYRNYQIKFCTYIYKINTVTLKIFYAETNTHKALPGTPTKEGLLSYPFWFSCFRTWSMLFPYILKHGKPEFSKSILPSQKQLPWQHHITKRGANKARKHSLKASKDFTPEEFKTQIKRLFPNMTRNHDHSMIIIRKSNTAAQNDFFHVWR